MKYIYRTLTIILFSIYLSGCASGPKYSDVSATFNEPAQDYGRIYIYRTTILGAAIQPKVLLNGEVVGKAVPKGFFYVDVKQGNHKITTTTEVKRSLSLVMAKGQTRYVRLNVSMGMFVGHVYPKLIDNAVGAQEIKQLSYTAGGK